MEYIEKVISDTEPLKIDDQSSPTTVYLRENIQRRSVLDPITQKYHTKYSYSEKRYTREEWLNETYKSLTEDRTKLQEDINTTQIAVAEVMAMILGGE